MTTEEIIIKIKLKDGNRLLANADVTIKTADWGPITIKNFMIWRSRNLNMRLQEYVNISPPCYRLEGHYRELVFFESGVCWEKLETMIWDQYQLAKAENTPIEINNLELEEADIK